MPTIDLSKYKNTLSRKHQIIRLIWSIVWPMCTWFLPRSMGSGWKRFVLNLFGARISKGVVIQSSIKVYYPKNLVVGKNSWLGDYVNFYNVDLITIGENVVVSQYSHLCTASHSVSESSFRLVTRPIAIDNCAWVAAEAFVGMGVRIGEGAVVGARAVVVKDVEPWSIVGGNPAITIKKREIKN